MNFIIFKLNLNTTNKLGARVPRFNMLLLNILMSQFLHL